MVFHSGRGAFETEGSGMPVNYGEIAFKCNFSYMNHVTRIVHKRRVDRHFSNWGLDLIKVIDGLEIPGFKGYKVVARHATEHRIGLKICGPGLSYKISATDPLVDNKRIKNVRALEPSAAKTAQIVSTLFEEVSPFSYFIG